MSAAQLSRRELFSWLIGRGPQRTETADLPKMKSPVSTTESRVAVIQGRRCLAYQKSFCSTCVERCPVPGAIVMNQGFPQVNPNLCNGCGICHDLCPAPSNAILLISKQNRFAKK